MCTYYTLFTLSIKRSLTGHERVGAECHVCPFHIMWIRQVVNNRITCGPLINFTSQLNHNSQRCSYHPINSTPLLSLKKSITMMNINDVKTVWRNADAVSFDVDSTVIREEGIDELAKFCGKGDQVTDLTKKAMQGNMTFQQSLNVRLNIIQPRLDQIKEFIRSHPPRLTPGIKELVDELHARNKKVFLVSGGFRCLISPVAAQLDIPQENICANRLKFYFNGDFAGFDENEPTSMSGGKAEVIRRLKKQYDIETLVHVGDGATDLEACPPADAFIGFGGNVVRESVKLGSLWFVEDLMELIDALD